MKRKLDIKAVVLLILSLFLLTLGILAIILLVKTTSEIKNKDKSPVVEFINVECDELTGKIYADVMLSYYKYYGFEKMPRYLI